MDDALGDLYGSILAVRAPVPVTINKAGANYKSEVAHLEYSPRRAYDEWLSICEGILAFGGDAIVDFELDDEPFLDRGPLSVDPGGFIHPLASAEHLGRIDGVLTGRVFAANGPWVRLEGKRMRALLPNMLAHRAAEEPYWRNLLTALADGAGCDLSVASNPHRWEGMADVAACGEQVVLTYTVAGHYDAGVTPRTLRSSREGVQYAADFAGVPAGARIYAELVYPHFHGDTVHFGARTSRGPVLFEYPGGLYGDGGTRIAAALPVKTIGKADAVEAYAANSRQVENGVLVPEGVSPEFLRSVADAGLQTTEVPLFELFGKGGGGPACATLYLPRSLSLPADFPLRYSVRRDEARRRRERIPDRVVVDPRFFEGRPRG